MTTHSVLTSASLRSHPYFLHDFACMGWNFDFSHKKLQLELKENLASDSCTYVVFLNVLRHEATSADYWGSSPHVLECSLVPDDKRKLFARYCSESELCGNDVHDTSGSKATMEIEITFTSGDTLRILCQSAIITGEQSGL